MKITNEMLERTNARQFNKNFNKFYHKPGPDPIAGVAINCLLILATATMLFIHFFITK